MGAGALDSFVLLLLSLNHLDVHTWVSTFLQPVTFGTMLKVGVLKIGKSMPAQFAYIFSFFSKPIAVMVNKLLKFLHYTWLVDLLFDSIQEIFFSKYLLHWEFHTTFQRVPYLFREYGICP